MIVRFVRPRFIVNVVGAIGSFGLLASEALAAPLLVVVEPATRGSCDPPVVRGRVAAELGREVVGPAHDGAGTAEDILIVAADRGEVVVSFRTGNRPDLSRRLSLHSEKDDCAQKVAWMAGNLVRDQVGNLVSQRPAPSSVQVPPLVERHPTTPPSVGAPPVPAASPLPTAPPLSDDSASLVVGARVAPDAAPDAERHWQVTLLGGPGFGLPVETVGAALWGVGWHLETQRAGGADSALFGVALESNPGEGLVGAAIFAGVGVEIRRWSFESTVGAGIEAARLQTATHTRVESSERGLVEEKTVTDNIGPLAFGRLAGGIGYRLTAHLDALARLELHLAARHTPEMSWAMTALGLRWRIQ